jgi:hypothetical protein
LFDSRLFILLKDHKLLNEGIYALKVYLWLALQDLPDVELLNDEVVLFVIYTICIFGSRILMLFLSEFI